MVYDVVISYAREDREIVSKLCNQMIAEDIQARMAPRDTIMDQRYITEVNAMMNEAKTLLVIISEYSSSSGQVVRELELADKNHMQIFQVRLDDVKPSGGLGYYLSGKQAFDMLRKEVEPWQTAQEISRFLKTGSVEDSKKKKKSRWGLFKSRR